MLTFNPDTHEYRWNGEVVPSVTQILVEWRPVGGVYVSLLTGDIVPRETFDRAREVGRDLHLGCSYLLSGQGLDWDYLSKELVEPLRKFDEWRQLMQVEPVAIEEPLYSPQLGIAGTPDLVCQMRSRKKLALIDVKTGGLGLVGPQTAAYAKMYQETHKKEVERYCLKLDKSGKNPVIKQLTGANDLGFFYARITQYKYLRDGKK